MKSSLNTILAGIAVITSVFYANAQTTTDDYIPDNLISEGLSAPGRMAVDTDDNVYITDAFQKNIVKYNAQGNYQGTITTDFNPISIAINKNNQLFAGDKATGNIYKIAQNGNKTLFYTGATLPNSMVFGLDILYITDSEQKKVLGLDVSGTVVTDFTYDTFTFPTGIAYDKQNNHIIVSEHGGIGEDVQTCGGGSMSWGTDGPLTTIYIFDINGGFITDFGCFGTKNGLFQRIQGITVGTCGNIYAVDPYLGRVNVFDDNGNYITKFGQQGNGAGEFNLPMDIVFTSDNRAFVASMNKGEIDIFTINQTLPSATITSADQTVCSLEDAFVEVQLTGTAPWSFTYTVDGLNPVTINTADLTTDPLIKSFNLPVTEVGLYEITAITDSTNTSGTCLTGAAYIKVSTPPTAAIVTNSLSKCSNDASGIEVQFTGIAPWTFTYTIDGLNPTEIITTDNPYTLIAEQSGLYEITALSDDACSGTEISGNAVVTVNPLPTATITNENTQLKINPGGNADIEIEFTGTAPFTFQYVITEENLTSVTTYDNPYTLTVSEIGAYEIMAISDKYCSNNEWQDWIGLILNDIVLPTTTITTGNIEICEGNSDNINVDFTGVAPWTFTYTVDGLNPTDISTSVNPYLISVSASGVYELSAVSDVNGDGTFSGLSTVSKFEQPIVDLGPDIHLCEGDPVYILDAGVHSSYLWSDGSTEQTLAVSAAGTYSVTVGNSYSCTATATVNVTVGSLPNAEFYYDINGLEVLFIRDATNDSSHNWDFGDGTNSSSEENPVHTYMKKGTYTVTYTNISDHCGTVQTSQTFKVGTKEDSDLVVIYPNPSYGEFTLKIHTGEPVTTNISVLVKSLSGQTILDKDFNPYQETYYNGNYYININLYNFTKGIYALSVSAGNVYEQEKLVLKN